MKLFGCILILFLLGNNLAAQEEDVIIDVIEPQPEFPGGYPKMIEFMTENIKYPQEAMDLKISGKVFVLFMIDSTGDIRDAKVVKGVDPLLDREALRVVEMMPCWTPGTQRGKKVNVWFTIPIIFKEN